MPPQLSPAVQTRRHAPSLGSELIRLWRALLRDCVDRYRPERHYMRGPGPRWHEKHGQALA